jgi:hypothetical protein
VPINDVFSVAKVPALAGVIGCPHITKVTCLCKVSHTHFTLPLAMQTCRLHMRMLPLTWILMSIATAVLLRLPRRPGGGL